MLYLLLSTLCFCSITILLNAAQRKGIDRNSLILCNYLFAFSISSVIALVELRGHSLSQLGQAELLSVFSQKSVPNTMLLAILLGAVVGVFCCLGISAVGKSVLCNGLGLTTMFSQSAFLLTIAVSMLLWREMPTAWTVVGVALILLAVFLTLAKDGGAQPNAGLLLSVLFLNGMVGVLQKIFVMGAAADGYESLMLAATFAAALLASVFLFVGKGAHAPVIDLRTVAVGLVIGASNALTNLFQMKALQILPASVVLASVSAGSLLVNAAVSRIVFKEKISGRRAIAFALAVVSLVLVNL